MLTTIPLHLRRPNVPLGFTVRILVIGLASGILAVALSGCNKGSSSQSSRQVTIGAVLPLSGDAAKYGKSIKDGMDLALEEFNVQNSDGGRKIKIIYEDDQGKAEVGRSATQKLISVNKVPVIVGGAMSSVASAIGPVCQERRVVLISPTASATSLRTVGNYFFRIAPSDELDGRLMADYAFNRLNLRRVAVIYVNLAYGKSIEQVFSKEFEALGGTVIASEAYGQGGTNFRSQLTKIKGLSPDGLYLPGYYAELANILKQARELGLQTRLLSANGFFDPELLKIAGDTAEGAIFTVSAYDPNTDDPLNKSFVAAFTAKYGREPDFFAVQGHDAVKLVMSAIEQAGTAPDGIRRHLAQAREFPGACHTSRNLCQKVA